MQLSVRLSQPSETYSLTLLPSTVPAIAQPEQKEALILVSACMTVA